MKEKRLLILNGCIGQLDNRGLQIKDTTSNKDDCLIRNHVRRHPVAAHCNNYYLEKHGKVDFAITSLKAKKTLLQHIFLRLVGLFTLF